MPVKSDKKVDWKGFVDIKLTDEEKTLFQQWDIHDEDLFILMSEAVAGGHKLSLTFNRQNDTFVASFTGNEGAGKHQGWTLSAFAPDWYAAVRVLTFKHAVLLNSNWDAANDRPTENIG